jgi:hypothetical protein
MTAVNQRLRMMCRHCGSEDVAYMTEVRWDVGLQQWVASDTVLCDAFCDKCGDETEVIDVYEVVTGFVDCDGAPFVPEAKENAHD